MSFPSSFNYLPVPVSATLDNPRTFRQSRTVDVSVRVTAAIEALAVAASPGLLYVVLRLRGMAPPRLPDPSMHTTFILDPHDIFVRYQALFDPTSRLREAGRVGFLVPARVSYLLFGGVPGFFVFRYLLALIAIVPVYLLLKRLYGRWAGFLGIAVVMSSPIVLTAWGTDYPDSAAVSYLTGGFAALGLSLAAPRRRAGWLVLAACLLTLATWSHGAAVPLVGVLIVVYLGVRLRRERTQLVRDVALLAGSAIVVTGLLAVCSKFLLGQFNFIGPTLRSASALSQPAELRANHSASWSWAPYDVYLLVPPAIVAAFLVVFARRWRDINPSVLFVALAGALQLAVFAYLQFLSNLQALEMHYFSSVLWSSVNLMLAIVLAELTRPFLGRGATEPSPDGAPERRTIGTAQVVRALAASVPALLVLGIALVYEAADRAGAPVPAMTWGRWGAALAAIVVAATVVGRLAIERLGSGGDGRSAARLTAGRLLSAGAVVAISAAVLVLSVAPPRTHGKLANTIYDPTPPYAHALGGNDTAEVDEYAVVSALPGFVGHAAYRGEVLLTWEPHRQFGDLQGPMGLFHNAFTWVSGTFPVLNPGGARKIKSWRAAQVLLMSHTGVDFAKAVRSLARFQPVVVHRGVLSHGSYHLHVWLVDLRRYVRA
jgi:hypothetical protein